MKHISVKDIEEFSQLFIPAERTELSKAVINVISENINNTKDVIYDIRVSIESENTDIVLSIIRNDFIQILEEQLQLFEEIEHYEECAKIVKLIQKIKAGSIVQSLVDNKHK